MKFATPLVLLVLTAAASPPGNTFLADMTTAMERMHHGMMRPASGDPDRDFAEMMIVHHEGAIDMAKIQLQYGKNEQLRRLAQGIIVEQQQEIATMKRILDEHKASH
ncbi:DUF305 domain-containing protein [Sphingomonas ginkgonis]|uniref:DUF305 domain-containing protein n=1 Tax=Sphingomonas ginkgonis TaxID=2315330 RepID=A0A3R9WRJ9_9SPHN|nr:DUF305 domain-containing protein [Sphingomonas ginkgonis]RST30113.1 DUF305 domain-containing protein [Sphingomonas ginkgonis]